MIRPRGRKRRGEGRYSEKGGYYVSPLFSHAGWLLDLVDKAIDKEHMERREGSYWLK